MILGTQKPCLRYLATGAAGLLFSGLVLIARLDEVAPVVALRRSLASTAVFYLVLTLMLGPLVVIWKPALKWLPWRRELGVWFAGFALAHALAVTGSSFQWNLLRTLSGPVGLAVLMGVVTLLATLLLAATSSDRAVRFLGVGSWKCLHYSVYAIFYLVFLHTVYFLFISSRTAVNRFGYPYLVAGLAVIGLQSAAFIRIVRAQRARLQPVDKAARGRKRNAYIMRLAKRRQIAEGTREIVFDAGRADYRFQAGQYAGFRLPKLLYPDPKGAFRVFSLASSPNDRQSISICFRVTGSGFKRSMLELPAGTPVEVSPAAGFLVLPPPGAREKIVLVAGGVGITPFISMLRFAAESKSPHDIRLICANRSEAASAYLPEIKRLAQENTRFSFENYLDETSFFAALAAVPDPGRCLWYIAGPRFMVASAKDLLARRPVEPTRILTEEFIGY